MKSKRKKYSSNTNNYIKNNNNTNQKSNNNSLESSDWNNIDNFDNIINSNKHIISKKKDMNFLEEPNNNGNLTPIKDKNNNINFNNINKKEKEMKPIIYDEFINSNSFIQSDIEEIKSIFNQNDLKSNAMNDKYIDTSNLFGNSEDTKDKKDEITINDLDPKIKDVTILFVLSSNYYELLVQEKAKKAFNFFKKNKK